MKVINQPSDYYLKAYFSPKRFVHQFHKKRIDKIISMIPNNSFVLDAGCGSAIVPYLLSTKSDCTGIGIDIRNECIDFASKQVPAFKFYQADIKSFSLPYKFDVVLCSEVLEHFDSKCQDHIIDCLHTHLKDRGFMVLTFPNKIYFIFEPLWKLIRRLIHPGTFYDDDYHHPIPLKNFIKGLLSRGYSVVSSGIYNMGLLYYIVMRKK